MNILSKLKTMLLGKQPYKLAVGYQLAGDVSFENIVSLVARYYNDISEFAFPLPDLPSDSPPGWMIRNLSYENLKLEMVRDLKLVKQLNIPGVMMVNGTCYGAVTIADEVRDFLINSIKEMKEYIDLKAVMVHSLFFAQTIRRNFPELEIRADASMHAGTIQQLKILAGYFDGFYIDCDVCRNLERVKQLRAWCQANGKSLHLMANSSCIHNCPYRFTCSNMTAHGIRPAFCHRLIGVNGRDLLMLQGNWIRPEDLEQYTPYFDTIQLYTRESRTPTEMLTAYITRHSCDDLRHLLSPDLSVNQGKLKPPFPINCLPPDWFAKTSTCNHQCDTCDYCRTIMTSLPSLQASQSQEASQETPQANPPKTVQSSRK